MCENSVANKRRHSSNITGFCAFKGLPECFGLNLDAVVHNALKFVL